MNGSKIQDSKEEIPIVTCKSLRRKILEEVTHSRPNTNFYQAHSPGSSYKNKNKQAENVSCFIHRTDLYKTAHSTLFFTTLEASHHLPLLPNSLFSQSRQQCLPEICKTLAHADHSLPALHLLSLSLRGPCPEGQPLSQLPRVSDTQRC